MPKRTYLDSGVLIAALKSENGDLQQRAMQVLDDPERELLLSDAVWLETMPKPIYEKQQDEISFYSFYNEVFHEAKKL
jgi:predicted nucleic acid-binding protein